LLHSVNGRDADVIERAAAPDIAGGGLQPVRGMLCLDLLRWALCLGT
jgi:hypothetical protein